MFKRLRGWRRCLKRQNVVLSQGNKIITKNPSKPKVWVDKTRFTFLPFTFLQAVDRLQTKTFRVFPHWFFARLPDQLTEKLRRHQHRCLYG